MIGFALLAPPMLVGPLLGAFIDRTNRKVFLLLSDGLRAILTALIPVVFLLYGLPGVLLITLLHSILTQLFAVAYASVLPDAVGEGRLTSANGLIHTTLHLGRIVGSGLGGILMATGNIFTPFWANAVTFLLSGLLILGLPWPPSLKPSTRREGKGNPVRETRPSYFKSLWEGFLYLRDQKPLWLYMAIGLVGTIGFAPAPVALVILAKEELGASSVGYSLLQALTTVGLAAGAFLVGRAAQDRQAATVMALGYLAMGITTLFLGWAPSLWVAAGLVLLRSGFNSVLSIPRLSLLQQMVPSAYRGRVFTWVSTVIELPRAIVLPLAGVLIDLVGVRVVYTAMAIAIAVAGGLAFQGRHVFERYLARHPHHSPSQA